MTTLLLNQGSNLAQTDSLLAWSFYLDQTMEEDRTNLVELRAPPESRLEKSLGQIKLSANPWWWSPRCVSGVQEGGQLRPQVACLKSERFQGPWRRIGHQRIRRYLRHKHFAEEWSKIVPFAAFANFYPLIIWVFWKITATELLGSNFGVPNSPIATQPPLPRRNRREGLVPIPAFILQVLNKQI